MCAGGEAVPDLLYRAWRRRCRAEIAFADGEVATADQISPPMENNGALDFTYRLLSTNREEKYREFGAPAGSSYLAHVPEVLSARILPGAAPEREPERLL